MADAEGASRRAIVGFYVWHQFILDELLQVRRFAVVVTLLEQPVVAVQGHRQVVVVAEIVDVPKCRRADAHDDETRTPAAVGVRLASHVEQAVYEVEHLAALRVEHVDDIVVGLVELLIASRCVDEHLSLVIEILRLHCEFLHAFEWNLRLSCNSDKDEQNGDDGFLVHVLCLL